MKLVPFTPSVAVIRMIFSGLALPFLPAKISAMESAGAGVVSFNGLGFVMGRLNEGRIDVAPVTELANFSAPGL